MTSLVSDIFGLRADEAIAADMALETPQIMVRWRLASIHPQINQVSLRRSKYNFPETLSDGDAILDEAISSQASVRTSYSDTDVEAMRVYYYSLFFEVFGPFSQDMNFSIDVSRLGILRSALTHSAYDTYWILTRADDASPVIWLYDINKFLATEKIDLSSIVTERDELVLSLISYSYSSPNRSFELITSRRYIAFTIDESAEEVATSDITSEFNFVGVLTSGFDIRGATKVGVNLAILDATNDEVVTTDTSGSIIRTMDLSGLDLLGNVYGLSYDSADSQLLVGYGNVVYAFDDTDVAPGNLDIEAYYPIRQAVNSDFHADVTLGVFLVVDRNTENFERYTADDKSAFYQIEQAPIPGPDIAGLYHMGDTGATLVDSSGNGNDVTPGGTPSQGVTGRFDEALELVAPATDNVDLDSVVASMDFDQGYLSFWYRTPYRGYAVSTTLSMLGFYVDISNYLRISLQSDGDLYFEFRRSGSINAVTWTNGISIIDDGEYHNIVLYWDNTVPVFEVFVDGVSVGSAVMAGVWAGPPTTNYLGGDGATLGGSVIGSYDELVIGTGVFSEFTRYTLTTRGNRAHALSGRDYSGDGQHWRDGLKYELGDYNLRNDYKVLPLPENEALSDGEIIHRQSSSDMELGDFGRLCRFVGLLLDRQTDRRKFFMDHVTPRTAEYEFLQELGRRIYASNMDSSWNVEVRRRFLEVMYYCYKRRGTLDAFKRLTRFLGFRLLCPDDIVGTLVDVSRRYFDSVVDPLRPDVPFDSGTFDSGADDVPFVTLQMKFFKQNFSSSTGATQATATRDFTDNNADFSIDAEVGSLIIINDQSTPADNGQYIITQIVSPIQVKVDRDWPTGSLSSLSYRLHWRVPVPDPYNDLILARLSDIKVKWQELSVIS